MIGKSSISLFFNDLIIFLGCVKLTSLAWLLMCWFQANVPPLKPGGLNEFCDEHSGAKHFKKEPEGDQVATKWVPKGDQNGPKGTQKEESTSQHTLCETSAKKV